jgi:hypothetical protein
MKCCRCQRVPQDIPDVRSAAKATGFGSNVERFIRAEEGTYNPRTGLFACDECYIAMGQPTGGPRGRWTPERLYEVNEVPGTGPQGAPGSQLRAAQDRIGALVGAPVIEKPEPGAIEVLPDGRVREGTTTYGPGHAVYACQSGKSPHCTKETRGTYYDGTFGYKGVVDTDPEKKKFFTQRNPDYRSVAICAPCFTWEHWNAIQRSDKTADKDRFVIVDGKHYAIGNESAPGPSHCRGFGGSRFRIRFHDGRYVESTNLWHQGTITDDFRADMPDNAVFVRDHEQQSWAAAREAAGLREANGGHEVR